MSNRSLLSPTALREGGDKKPFALQTVYAAQRGATSTT